MSSPNERTQIDSTISPKSYWGEREERIEEGDQMSHTVLAPSVVRPTEKTHMEPYSGIEFGLTFERIQSAIGTSTPSSPAQTMPVINRPGEGVARRGQPISEKERQKNALRIQKYQKQRHHVREQKDRIKRLLPRRIGRAPPSSELQLWAEAAEYIECLQAENIRLKKQAEIQEEAPILPNRLVWNVTTSPTVPAEMSYLPWEPVSSDRDPGLANISGASSSMMGNGDIFGTGTAAMTPAPDWSFWDSYDPISASAQAQSASIEEAEVRWPQNVAESVPGSLNSQLFSAAPPAWDPSMLGYREDYPSPWNETLGQYVQTDVNITNQPNHEVGQKNSASDHGSTERLDGNYANSGMQDYSFVFE